MLVREPLLVSTSSDVWLRASKSRSRLQLKLLLNNQKLARFQILCLWYFHNPLKTFTSNVFNRLKRNRTVKKMLKIKVLQMSNCLLGSLGTTLWHEIRAKMADASSSLRSARKRVHATLRLKERSIGQLTCQMRLSWSWSRKLSHLLQALYKSTRCSHRLLIC